MCSSKDAGDPKRALLLLLRLTNEDITITSTET